MCETGHYWANIMVSSAKALNSSALPLGSLRKNVACSPGKTFETDLRLDDEIDTVRAAIFPQVPSRRVMERMTPK